MDDQQRLGRTVYPVQPVGLKWLTWIGLGLVGLGVILGLAIGEPVLLTVFGVIGGLLAVAGGLLWGNARHRFELSEDGLLQATSGKPKLVPWSDIVRVQDQKHATMVWTRDSVIGIPRGKAVTDREDLIAQIQSRLDERPVGQVGQPLDLSPVLAEGETVTVRNQFNPWAFAAACLGAVLFLAFFAFLAKQGQAGGMVYPMIMVFGGLGALWARQNRIAFDRDGLTVTTPKLRKSLSWADVEDINQDQHGWIIKTRTGRVQVLKSHENAQRLLETVHFVLRAKERGVIIDTAAGASPAALSHAEHGAAADETSLSRAERLTGEPTSTASATVDASA